MAPHGPAGRRTGEPASRRPTDADGRAKVEHPGRWTPGPAPRSSNRQRAVDRLIHRPLCLSWVAEPSHRPIRGSISAGTHIIARAAEADAKATGERVGGPIEQPADRRHHRRTGAIKGALRGGGAGDLVLAERHEAADLELKAADQGSEA